MKKTLVFVLCALVLLLAFGCGGTAQNDNKNTTVKNSPQGSSKAYVADKFTGGTTYRLGPDENGKSYTITLAQEENTLALTVDGIQVLNKEGNDVAANAMINDAGDAILLLTYKTVQSESYETLVYYINGDKVKNTDTIYGSVDGIETSGALHMKETIYFIGAWNAGIVRKLDKDYKLDNTGEVQYNLGASSTRCMTTLIDIEFTMAGDNGKKEVLPAGTKLYPAFTDTETYFSFYTEEGIMATVKTSYDGDAVFINGEHVDTECFDNIIYAD